MPAPEPSLEKPVRPQGWARGREEPSCPPGWHIGPPDFVGVGAQRCGTGWWYGGAIRRHPQVAIAPERRKEVHFFDRYWSTDPEPDFVARYHRHFPRPEGSITGEWTPRYMHDPWTLPLLAEAASGARFLVLLRDPIERYRSGIRHQADRSRRRGHDPPDIAIVGDAIARGLYHHQVARALELLGRDSVLVLQYERCIAEPLAEMRRTHAFLGLEPLEKLPARLRRERAPAEKPSIPSRLRSELRARFADDVRRLVALCPEIDPELWPNFSDI